MSKRYQCGFSSIIIIIALTAVALIAVSYLVYARNRSASTRQDKDSNLSRSAVHEAQRKAIREAELYTPDGSCADVLTPAVHNESAATYTFPSSCLPDGWTAEENAQAGGKIRTCPDEWYDNQMPGPPSNDTSTQYFVIKGERRELKDYDVEWIKQNCRVNQPTVVQ